MCTGSIFLFLEITLINCFFTTQQITTALAQYRSMNLVSVGACASSTVKSEAVIQRQLLPASELQVRVFAALQLP